MNLHLRGIRHARVQALRSTTGKNAAATGRPVRADQSRAAEGERRSAQVDDAACAIGSVRTDGAVNERGRRCGISRVVLRRDVDVDLSARGLAIGSDENGAAHCDLSAIHGDAATTAGGAIGIHTSAESGAALAACIDSDLPAVAAGTARHQSARAFDVATIGAQDDASALLRGCGGRDASGVANGQCIHIAAVSFELRHIGGDEAAVAHASAALRACGIANDHTLIACGHDQHIRARGQSHGAVGRTNGAGVVDLETNEKHIAAGGADGARIGDSRRGVSLIRHLPTGHEHVVAQVQRRCRESCHIHHRAPAKHDAAGIDEKDLAVRSQRAVQERRSAVQHAVQCGGRGARHDEIRVLAAADVERAPVNDRAVRLLMDCRQSGEAVLNLCITQHHHTPRGIGLAWNFHAQKQKP